jgi:hypothetical protein
MSKSKKYPEYTGNNFDWEMARRQNQPRYILEHLNHVRALDNQAADNEVQGIITGKKDIDRSPVRPAHPVPEEQFNPTKPNMQWNELDELVAADDEVKQLLLSRRKVGGCTDRQKGIAAQLRTFTNGDLREELNNIVHSGDSITAKSHHPSNHYIDLSNSFDSKVENLLKKAIDFIKDNEKISYKNKKKILNGIVNFNSTTNATTMHNKPTTTLSRVTPRKTFKDATNVHRMTTNTTVKSRRNQRSRSRNRNRRNRSRRSRKSRS